MGTKADFYVGRSDAAEWIGSIAWDGYPDGVDEAVRTATDEATYRSAVAEFLAGRDDATLPEHGWPWPWETSATTDYAYAFDGGAVWASGYGSPWFDATAEEPDDDELTGDRPTFPDMSAVQNVTLGKRSGVIVFGVLS